MFLYDIFKVLYSPVKAFREVLENPRYIGPLLIIIVSIGLTLGTSYMTASQHYLEVISPTTPRDIWTNASIPLPIWTTNASVGTISAISNANSGLLAGNYSVRAMASNTSEIWLRATNIGTINCSDPGGFRKFYYKLNYTAMNQTNASQTALSAQLRMLSYDNESRSFKFDLMSSQNYLNTSGQWTDANVTLSNWENIGDANWANITGFEFRLGFPEKGQLSLTLDDLYFGGKYQLLFDYLGPSDWTASTLISSSFDVFLRWLIFAAMLWLTVKVFSPEGVPFRTLLVVVGYAFVIMFVYLPVEIVSATQLMPLYFPNRVIYPLTGQELAASSTLTDNIYAAWTPTLPYEVFVGVWYISHIWTIALFAVALTISKSFSYKKAVLIAVIAYIIGLFLRTIIPL